MVIMKSLLIFYFILVLFFYKYMYIFLMKIKSFILKNYQNNENLLYLPVIIDLIIRNDKYLLLFLLLSLFFIKYKLQKKEMFYFRSTLFLYSVSLLLVIVNVRSVSDRLSVWVFIYFVMYVSYHIFKKHKPKQ